MMTRFRYNGKEYKNYGQALKEYQLDYQSFKGYMNRNNVPIQEALDALLGESVYQDVRLELEQLIYCARWNDLGTTQKAANARGGWICLP